MDRKRVTVTILVDGEKVELSMMAPEDSVRAFTREMSSRALSALGYDA